MPDDVEFVEVEVTIADWTDAPQEKKDDKPAAELRLRDLSQQVADEVTALIRSGELVNVQHFRVITADNQTASIQTGAQTPRVTQSQQGPRGTVNAVEYRSTGSQVTISTRLLPNDRIAFEFSLSRSNFSPQADGPVLSESPGGGTVKADSLQTLTLRTLALVPNGETALVSGLRDGQQGCLVLLSAKKIPAKSGDGK